jgi:hypothetical protein
MRILAILSVACNGSQVSLDGSDTGAPTNPNTNCDGAQTYVADIAVTSDLSGETASIVAAVPTPPDVGDNTWTVTVTDELGQPVTGLSPKVSPWMPLHGHGLIPADYAGTETDPGTYDFATFRLTMPGLWEFPIELGTTDAPDPVAFRFCAEG